MGWDEECGVGFDRVVGAGTNFEQLFDEERGRVVCDEWDLHGIWDGVGLHGKYCVYYPHEAQGLTAL